MIAYLKLFTRNKFIELVNWLYESRGGLIVIGLMILVTIIGWICSSPPTSITVNYIFTCFLVGMLISCVILLILAVVVIAYIGLMNLVSLIKHNHQLAKNGTKVDFVWKKPPYPNPDEEL